MGTKTWMLVYADSNAREALRTNPQLDRQSTQTLATTLFPREKLEAVGDADLSYTYPPDNELSIGCFPGVSIIAAKEFGIDHPSMLPQRFIIPAGAGIVTLHAMHSVVDWIAFAQWRNGKLLRSLSLSANSGSWKILDSGWRSSSPSGLESTRQSTNTRKKMTALPPSRFTHWNSVRPPCWSYSDILNLN